MRTRTLVLLLAGAGLAHAEPQPVTPHMAALTQRTATRFSPQAVAHVRSAIALGQAAGPSRLWDRDKTSFVANHGHDTIEIDVGRKRFSSRVSGDAPAGQTRFARYDEKRMLFGLVRVRTTIDTHDRATPQGGSAVASVNANRRELQVGRWVIPWGRADLTLPKAGVVK